MATKLELTQLLATRNTELEAARLRISVLEGELALRPRPSVAQPTKAAYTKTFVKGGKTFARVCIGFNTFAIREVTA